jgi:flagellar basal-body rod protein FlgF
MNSGMYAAISGSMVGQERMEVLTNNLANVNTAGFKRDRLSFESILGAVKNPSIAAGSLTDAPVMSTVTLKTDYSPGSLKNTGNVLDVALDGDGFFVVNTPEGRAYTRQGNFHLDADGKLINSEGNEVLAGGGPVTIKGGKVEIDSEGKISVDGNRVGVLDVVDFPKPYQLKKTGGVLFIPDGENAVEQPSRNMTVRQGVLEESNVNSIFEMLQLIESNRYNESCAKVIQNYDSMASKAANELGKL